jgi:hypothetical protein
MLAERILALDWKIGISCGVWIHWYCIFLNNRYIVAIQPTEFALLDRPPFGAAFLVFGAMIPK